MSDHLPSFIIVNKFSTLPKKIKIIKRDYSNYDEEKRLLEFRAVNWKSVFDNTDEESFHIKVSDINDNNIPIKVLSKKDIKSISKPWITSGIKISLAINNKLNKKLISTRSDYCHRKFKCYRNKRNHLICISKRNYYDKYFSDNKTNIKNIWKGIKQIISLKPSACDISLAKGNLSTVRILEMFLTIIL